MRTRFIGVFAGCSLLGLAHVASAATAEAAGDPAASSAPAVLEEVIVSARRREESLQDVPLVVQAVTNEELAKLSIRDFRDVASLVPGLTMANNANGIGTTSSMRGVNFDVNASGNNGTIEYYFNDMPGASGFMFQAMYDVGQIEVLRGPQGTLRGRSTPSGSITLTTHKPDLNDFGGYASLTSNDIGAQNINGALNFPLIDGKLAVRIAGLSDNNEGSRVSSVNSVTQPSNKTRAGRVTINFQPNDSFSMLVGINRLNLKSQLYTQVESLRYFDPTAAFSPVMIRAQDRLAVQDFPQNNDLTWDVFTAQMEWLVGGQRVNFAASQMNQHFVSKGVGDVGDFFNSSFPQSFQSYGQGTNTHAYTDSGELRVANVEPLFGHLDYVAGAFSEHLSSPTDLTSITVINLVAAAAPSPTANTIFNVTPIARRGHAKEESIFANLTYKLDALELALGGRKIKYANEGHLNISGAQVPAAEDNSLYHATVFNASAKYRFNDRMMVYVSTGTSFRPGISVTGDFSVQQSPLERSFLVLPPEKSRSYELGAKTSWLDNRLKLNGALYHQEFNNYPWRSPGGVAYVSYATSTPPGGPNVASVGGFNFVGAVPVKIDGLELEADFRASSHWTIGGNAAYAVGKIQNGLVPCNDYFPRDGVPDTVAPPTTVAQIQAGTGTAENISGCRVNFRSSFQGLFNASAQTEYTRPVKGYDGFARGQLSYYGDSKNDPTNPVDDVKSYSLLNLYLGLRDPKAGWEVMFYGKNVTNTFRVLGQGNSAITTGYRTLLGPQTGVTTYRNVNVTAPREIGVSMRYAFGSK
jgi:iron complex outermembrane recepter protein